MSSLPYRIYRRRPTIFNLNRCARTVFRFSSYGVVSRLRFSWRRSKKREATKWTSGMSRKPAVNAFHMKRVLARRYLLQPIFCLVVPKAYWTSAYYININNIVKNSWYKDYRDALYLSAWKLMHRHPIFPQLLQVIISSCANASYKGSRMYNND